MSYMRGIVIKMYKCLKTAHMQGWDISTNTNQLGLQAKLPSQGELLVGIYKHTATVMQGRET